MGRPNSQYPDGKKSTDKRDASEYEEDKQRLEKQEEEKSIPKNNE